MQNTLQGIIDTQTTYANQLTLIQNGYIDFENLQTGIEIGKSSLDNSNPLLDEVTPALEAMKAAYPKNVVTTVIGVDSADEKNFAETFENGVTLLNQKAKGVDEDLIARKRALDKVLIGID